MSKRQFRPRRGALSLAVAVAVVGLLAGVPVSGAAEPGSCPGSDLTPTAANHEQIEAAVFCLVNAERVARSLVPLRPDRRLDQAARAHNEDMQARGYFSHTSPTGSTGADRTRATGYPGDTGENLLKGTVTPAEAVRLWLERPAHRANILEPAYRATGTAQGGKYWTQSFGLMAPSPDSSSAGGAGEHGSSDTSSQGGAPTPGGTGDSRVIPGTGGSQGGSGSATGSGGAFPAKLRDVRAHVRGGRLLAYAKVSHRTDGDVVRVSFRANGRRFSFTEHIENGRLRLSRRLPESQRSVSTGIVKIEYAGNERVWPVEVRMRAASRSARFDRQLLSLQGGVLRARGTVSRRARGVVRMRLVTSRGFEWKARARIANGTWRLRAILPPEVREGGYMTIQFTGYRPARIRGAQIAKRVLAGQSFGVR